MSTLQNPLQFIFPSLKLVDKHSLVKATSGSPNVISVHHMTILGSRPFLTYTPRFFLPALVPQLGTDGKYDRDKVRHDDKKGTFSAQRLKGFLQNVLLQIMNQTININVCNHKCTINRLLIVENKVEPQLKHSLYNSSITKQSQIAFI